jgi:translation initiation factor 2 alpha subunit (eIF-2alpha)
MREVKKVGDLRAFVSEGVTLLCEILTSAVEGESNSESLKIEVEPTPTYNADVGASRKEMSAEGKTDAQPLVDP